MKEIPESTTKIINKFIEGVNKILGDRVKKIILYGSYARGDFNESSDIDIMISTDLADDELEEYKTKISDYAWEIEYNNNFEIDLSPLIKNIDKYNKRIEVIPFYMNVQKEGVVLYGR